VATCRDDPLYSRIERAVAAIFANGNIVAPVDVLLRLGLLAPDRLEQWRRGRTVHLEQVIDCIRTRLSRPPRILRFHAHDLKLVPSVAVYASQDTCRSRRLRFTKSGQAAIEEAYARHFVWPAKGPFPAQCPEEAAA
jgi:hypothetical protein